MLVEKGRAISEVAKDLELSEPTLRRWVKATTNSNHNLAVVPNLLEQNFNIETPNTVWVGDLTYNWTDEGWPYTAIVKDLCTKDVVGYTMGNRMTKELVIKAMKMAVRKEKPAPGQIFHSDRGSRLLF